MKLYVGSRDYKPEGYIRVDIDPEKKPDIVADITDMSSAVADCSCDEVVAGHVLEHIEWPDSFTAMAEFARVLKPGGVVKISVPDMAAFVRMLLSGESAFHVMALIYGVGGRANALERHRYGFTPGMLTDILEALGFGEFDWWNSSVPDASNGWAPRGLDERIGMSLNIQAVKVGMPTVDPFLMRQELLQAPMDDFVTIVSRVEGRKGPSSDAQDRAVSAKLLQLMHYRLIEAHQRIRYLEGCAPPDAQQVSARDEHSALRSALRRLIARL